MREWLCKIICGKKVAAHDAAGRANSDRQDSTLDLEAKVRDIRRRINEQNRRLDRYSTSSHNVQSETRISQKKDLDTAPKTTSRDAELNALKAKLMGKK